MVFLSYIDKLGMEFELKPEAIFEVYLEQKDRSGGKPSSNSIIRAKCNLRRQYRINLGISMHILVTTRK